eukprot:ANDGO_06662.mRNA.1 hypothetical protein PPTG_05169
MTEPSSPTHSVDFGAIDELDPSLDGGFHVVYDREVPVEIRTTVSVADTKPSSRKTDVGTLEAIKIKVLLAGEDAEPTSVKVELSSESDLFFHYVAVLTQNTYSALQDSQKLMVEFCEFATILIKMLNDCIREPHTHLAVFVMQRNGPGQLEFIQNMEYKFVELLSLDFDRSSEETVRSHITFRYNAVKSRLQLMQARLQDVSALVKLKNPSLLLQIQKTPSKSKKM